MRYPLSRFPQGGKALNESPSPLGEGRDGGNLKTELLIKIYGLN